MASKEKIVKQAAALFAELGIKSIRMDDIAHELSVSKRTLYEMFADKEDLLYQCVKYMREQREERILSQVDIENEGLTALLKMFMCMLDTSERYQRLSSNVKKFYPEMYARLAIEGRDVGLARLKTMIEQLMAQGLISPNINVDLSVTMFYYSANGVFSRGDNIVLPDGVTMRQAAGYMFVNFFRGIATQQGVQQIDDFLATQAIE